MRGESPPEEELLVVDPSILKQAHSRVGQALRGSLPALWKPRALFLGLDTGSPMSEPARR